MFTRDDAGIITMDRRRPLVPLALYRRYTNTVHHKALFVIPAQYPRTIGPKPFAASKVPVSVIADMASQALPTVQRSDTAETRQLSTKSNSPLWAAKTTHAPPSYFLCFDRRRLKTLVTIHRHTLASSAHLAVRLGTDGPAATARASSGWTILRRASTRAAFLEGQ